MTRTEFFNALKAGAVWDVGVSIHRTNPLPLDQLEIFETETDLQTYIKTNKLAYPGQIVTLLEGNTTTVYVVEEVGTNAKLKELAATNDTNAALTKIKNLLGYKEDYSGDSVKVQLDNLKSNAIIKGKTSNVLLVDGSDSGKTIGWEPGNTSEEGKQIPTAENVRSYVTSTVSSYVQGSKIEAIDDAPTHQEVPSALAVKNYVDLAVTGASKYLGPVGTLAALNGLNPDSKGDFARASASFNFADGTSVHTGDLLICEDVTKKTWSIIHGETDQILSIVGGAGLTVNNKDVHNPIIAHSNSVTAVTETAEETQALDYGEEFGIKQYSYDAQGHITGSVSKQLKLPNEPTLTGLGGITPAQVDTKISTAVNNLDVAEVKVGADQTLTAISQVDGKIKATATKIAIETSQVNGLNSALEKLDGLNNYVLPPSTTTTLGGIIVGDNLTITETGKLSAKDTTYDDVTTTTHGLMTAADKIKLNGIAEGANKTIVDASLNATSTNPVENKAVHAEFNSVRKDLADTSSGLQSQIDDHATLIGNKVDKVEGKGLSTNDYTTEEKNKLAGIATGATKVSASTTNGYIKIGSIDTKVYTLPTASTTVLGGIKIGERLTIDETTGKLSGPTLASLGGMASTDVDAKITTAIGLLAIDGVTVDGSKTIASISQTNGKIAVTTQDISITSAQVAGLNNFMGTTEAELTTLKKIKVTNNSVTDGTNTFNKYVLPTAKLNTLGGIKLKHTAMITDADINEETTTPNRFYAVNVDKEGYAFVNVPWTDTGLSPATTTDLGGIKIATVQTADNFKGGPKVKLQLDNDNVGFINLELLTGNPAKASLTWCQDENQVYLGVQSVSTDKLVQGTNTLIINGGGAAW